MSMFLWGKVKSKKEQNEIINGHIIIDDSVAFFSNKQNNLFISPLEEGEIYFNLALGYADFENLEEYFSKHKYMNVHENYFNPENWESAEDNDYKVIVKKFKSIISALFKLHNVCRITLYASVQGINFKECLYGDPITLSLNDFEKTIFDLMKKNYYNIPTCKMIVSN